MHLLEAGINIFYILAQKEISTGLFDTLETFCVMMRSTLLSIQSCKSLLHELKETTKSDIF